MQMTSNTPDTKDAMRYRWLRDRAFLNSPNCEEDFVALARKLANRHGKESDALIDAAMEECEYCKGAGKNPNHQPLTK